VDAGLVSNPMSSESALAGPSVSTGTHCLS
jgi:hypothetical protein